MTDENGPILAAIADVKFEIRELRGGVNNINRELGGVQEALKTIEKGNTTRDAELKDIRQQQSDCSARTGYLGVNARLKKLEKADEDITGSIDVVAQRQAAMNGSKARPSLMPVSYAAKKMLPWLVLAVIGGAALGGYILAMLFWGKA